MADTGSYTSQQGKEYLEGFIKYLTTLKFTGAG